MKTLFINRNDERTFRENASQYWILFKILRPISFYLEIKEIGKSINDNNTVGDVIIHKYLIRNNRILTDKLDDYIPTKEDFEFYSYDKQPNSLAAIVIKDGFAYFCMPSNSIYEIKHLDTETEDFLEPCNGYKTSERVIDLSDENTIYPVIRRTLYYDTNADGLVYEDINKKLINNYIKGFYSSDLGETGTIRFNIKTGESCYLRLFVSVSHNRSSEIILFIGKNTDDINVKGKVINGDVRWDDISVYTYSSYVYITIKQGSRLYILENTNINNLGNIELNYTINSVVPEDAKQITLFHGYFYSTDSDYSSYFDYTVAPHAKSLYICYYDHDSNTVKRYDGNDWNVPLAGFTADRPANVKVGTQYFDTTLNKPIWWTGTKWVDATGAAV